jgi:hypothetical protein
MRRPRPEETLVIVGCSRRKASTVEPIAALDLYQGGVVPCLRARVAGRPALRSRIRIISAEHGLVRADTRLLPYDRRIDRARARELRPVVNAAVRQDAVIGRIPTHVLVVAEPPYLHTLLDLPRILTPAQVEWIDDPANGWSAADAILTDWSWPCP